jgi:hypothetical protein
MQSCLMALTNIFLISCCSVLGTVRALCRRREGELPHIGPISQAFQTSHRLRMADISSHVFVEADKMCDECREQAFKYKCPGMRPRPLFSVAVCKHHGCGIFHAIDVSDLLQAVWHAHVA